MSQIMRGKNTLRSSPPKKNSKKTPPTGCPPLAPSAPRPPLPRSNWKVRWPIDGLKVAVRAKSRSENGKPKGFVQPHLPEKFIAIHNLVGFIVAFSQMLNYFLQLIIYPWFQVVFQLDVSLSDMIGTHSILLDLLLQLWSPFSCHHTFHFLVFSMDDPEMANKFALRYPRHLRESTFTSFKFRMLGRYLVLRSCDVAIIWSEEIPFL